MKSIIKYAILIAISLLGVVGCNIGASTNYDGSNKELSNKVIIPPVRFPSDDKYYGYKGGEDFGRCFAALDGASTGAHQMFSPQPKFGNYYGNGIPMLLALKNAKESWSIKHLTKGGNPSFNWNLEESSVQFIDPNPEVGCQSKEVIAKGETCYMYVIAKFKIKNNELKIPIQNFGTRTYLIYDDLNHTAVTLPITMSNIQTVHSIRQIMPFESQYFTSAVKGNLDKYQIVRVQNISYNENKVLEIKPNGIRLKSGKDNIFMLQHRQNNGVDSIYGKYPECGTPDSINNDTNKISSLKQSEECLLIYKMSEQSSGEPVVEDILDIKTNATAAPNSSPQLNSNGGGQYEDPVSPEIKLTAKYKSTITSTVEGIDWKQSNISDRKFAKAYYGNGVWVSPSDNGLYYSNDGKTWIISKIESGNFSSVAYGNKMWVASGANRNGLYYSSNGVDWFLVQNLSHRRLYTNRNRTVYFYNNKFFVFDNIFYSINSEDGKNWGVDEILLGIKPRKLFYINNEWYEFDYSKFPQAETHEEEYYHEADIMASAWSFGWGGIPFVRKVWNKPYSDIVNNEPLIIDYARDFNTVMYADNIWVASKGDILYYSLDKILWTSKRVDNKVSAIYFANNIWVAVGNKGILYSIDGKSWLSSNVNVSFNFVYAANGVWVAGGSDGLYTSLDGKSWTKAYINGTNFNSANYSNGIWVVSSDNGLWYGTEVNTKIAGDAEIFTINY
ncbi:MAG: hypothetical protein PHC75_06880 [Burkholderiales bacterium]|nr:hypothetical protein [Burkholderiales bacterium]